jgi:hypothetical protein
MPEDAELWPAPFRDAGSHVESRLVDRQRQLRTILFASHYGEIGECLDEMHPILQQVSSGLDGAAEMPHRDLAGLCHLGETWLAEQERGEIRQIHTRHR